MFVLVRLLPGIAPTQYVPLLLNRIKVGFQSIPPVKEPAFDDIGFTPIIAGNVSSGAAEIKHFDINGGINKGGQIIYALVGGKGVGLFNFYTAPGVIHFRLNFNRTDIDFGIGL